MTDDPTPNQRATPTSGPVPLDRPSADAPPGIPVEEIESTPGPSHGPRLWPRILGVLILLVGAGGAWEWQNPGFFRKSLTSLLPGLTSRDTAPDPLKILEARVGKLEQRTEPDLGSVNARLDALEKRAPAAPDLRPLQARLDALEARVSRPTAAIPVDGDLRPLLARIEALETRAAERSNVPAKVDAIASRVEALATRDPTAELRDRLDELERQLSGLTAKDAGMAEVSDRTARLARLEAARAALTSGRPLGPIPDAPPALTRFATAAPPTEAALRLRFPAVAQTAMKVSQPDVDGKPFLERVVARLQDFRLITVREGDRVLVGNAAVAALTRVRTLLDAGDLEGATKLTASISGPPAEKLAPWLDDARALVAAREALATLAGDS